MPGHDIPRVPANDVAVRVISRASNSQKYKDPESIGSEQKQFILLINEALARGVMAPPEGVKDYRGVQQGKVRVVTYSHSVKKPGKTRKHYWVVRCVCGQHEMRTSISLGNQDKEVETDACAQCKHMEVLRKRASGLPIEVLDAQQQAAREKAAEQRAKAAATAVPTPQPAPKKAPQDRSKSGPAWPTLGALFGS